MLIDAIHKKNIKKYSDSIRNCINHIKKSFIKLQGEQQKKSANKQSTPPMYREFRNTDDYPAQPPMPL